MLNSPNGRQVCNTTVTLQLNPQTGAILIEIPQTAELFVLEVQSKLFYSSSKELIAFEFTPDFEKTQVKEYTFDQKTSCFLPKHLWSVSSNKIHNPKPIIPSEQKSVKVNVLVNGKLGSRPVIEAATEWIGKGEYVIESKGLYSTDIHARPSTCIQDVKVVALAEAGEDVFSYQIERSITDIAQKKANMNCWQFCLLSYIEAGRLSWKAVGALYKEIDSGKEDVRIPDAMKYGKYHFIDFKNEETTPKAGDIICFSRQINKDWHCALFVKKTGDEDQFSVIEILNSPVDESTSSLKHDSVSFVKSEDVEGNILNFLEHRGVYSKIDANKKYSL